MRPRDQVLEVWGDLACFTRPELKVERFSYPVITPSSARGIFDAIYWKPSSDGKAAEFCWQVTRVEILAPMRYIALRRNEVKDKVPVAAVKKWMRGKAEPEPLLADATKDMTGNDQRGRTQRQTMALKNVRYRLHAQVRPWPGFESRLQGIEAQFRRRASSGKCFYQPYFGCKEFAAWFELVGPDTPAAEPIAQDMDLGLMLFDVFDLSSPGSAASHPSISLFHARVRGGILDIPDYDSDQVHRAVGRERL